MCLPVRYHPTPPSVTSAVFLYGRFGVFKTSLQKLLKERRTQTLPMSEVRSYLAEKHAARPFTAGEIEAATDRMMEANQLMVADDQLFLI